MLRVPRWQERSQTGLPALPVLTHQSNPTRSIRRRESSLDFICHHFTRKSTKLQPRLHSSLHCRPSVYSRGQPLIQLCGKSSRDETSVVHLFWQFFSQNLPTGPRPGNCLIFRKTANSWFVQTQARAEVDDHVSPHEVSDSIEFGAGATSCSVLGESDRCWVVLLSCAFGNLIENWKLAFFRSIIFN